MKKLLAALMAFAVFFSPLAPFARRARADEGPKIIQPRFKAEVQVTGQPVANQVLIFTSAGVWDAGTAPAGATTSNWATVLSNAPNPGHSGANNVLIDSGQGLAVGGASAVANKIMLGPASSLSSANSMDIVNNGAAADLVLTTYGAGSNAGSTVRGRTASGTLAAPTATVSGAYLLQMSGRGYDATNVFGGVAADGAFQVQAAQAFTPTARGTRILFQVTPNGTILSTDAWAVDQTLGLVGVSTALVGFSSGSTLQPPTVDTTLSRNAAGVIQFGTTTTNAAGSWLATNGTLSDTTASNAIVLSVTKNPAGVQNGDGIRVTMGATTTGNGLTVLQSGTGAALLLGGDTRFTADVTYDLGQTGARARFLNVNGIACGGNTAPTAGEILNSTGTSMVRIVAGNLIVGSATLIGWSSGSPTAQPVDTRLRRTAANTCTFDDGAGGAGTFVVTGKLTVTGAIDPTSVSLSSGTALFFDSADGSTAPVSAANHGRIRYLDGTGWQVSANGGAYATLSTGGASSLGATINVGNVVNSVVASGQITFTTGGTYTAAAPEWKGPTDQPTWIMGAGVATGPTPGAVANSNNALVLAAQNAGSGYFQVLYGNAGFTGALVVQGGSVLSAGTTTVGGSLLVAAGAATTSSAPTTTLSSGSTTGTIATSAAVLTLNGATNGTAGSWSLTGSGSSGTDVTGTSGTLTLPLGTGAGAPGQMRFGVSPIIAGGGSSTTLQTAVNVFILQGVQNNLSGTNNVAQVVATWADAGSTSGGSNRTLFVNPTYNYTAGTKSAATADIQVDRVETSLSTGAQNLLLMRAGAAGTTEKFKVNNQGTLLNNGAFVPLTATYFTFYDSTGTSGGVVKTGGLVASADGFAGTSVTSGVVVGDSAGNGFYGFYNTSDVLDCTIGRSAAGVVQFGTTANNSSGSWLATNGQLVGTLTKVKNVSTVAWGTPAIYGTGRATAQTAANTSVATYTVGAADGTFVIYSNLNVTTSTTYSINVQVTYTDESSNAQTVTLNFQSTGGTLLTAITNVQGAGPYEGIPVTIRAKNGTAITVKTAGTFTSVTYNVEGHIHQIA